MSISAWGTDGLQQFALPMERALPAVDLAEDQVLVWDAITKLIKYKLVANINGLNLAYLGGFATDPTTRPNTQPLQAGDAYFNLTSLSLRVYSGSVWDNFVGVSFAELAAALGAALIGWQQTGVTPVKRAVDKKLQDTVNVGDMALTVGIGGNDHTAVMRGIAEMDRRGGGTLVLQPNMSWFPHVQLPRGVHLSGAAGLGTRATPFAAGATCLVEVIGGLADVSQISFSNPAARAAAAIRVVKPAGEANLASVLERNFYSGFASAVKSVTGDCVFLDRSTFISNPIALDSLDDCRNSSMKDCYVLGGSGAKFAKVTQGVEGFEASGNKLLLGPTGSFGFLFSAALDIVLTNNIIDQVVTGQGVVLDASVNSISSVKLDKNYIGRQLAATGADFGVYAVGAVDSLRLSANTYAGWREAAVFINGLSTRVAADVHIADEIFSSDDRSVRDIKINYAQRTRISGAQFSGTASIDEGTGVDGTVTACTFDESAVPNSALGLRYGPQTSGFALISKGTVTVPAAGTAQVVTHGLARQPTIADIQLTIGAQGTTDFGYMFVTNITATQFTISPRLAPGSDVLVGWLADATRQ